MKTNRQKTITIAFLMFSLFGIGGCAFKEGEPWASATFSLTPRFKAEGKLQPNHRFLTSRGFEVSVNRITFRVDTVNLKVADDDAPAVGFDPAKPPPGYLLCHLGHCHSKDGRLVPYKEVAAEVVGGTGKGRGQLSLVAETLIPIEFGDKPTENTVGNKFSKFICPSSSVEGDTCDLPSGEPSLLQVHISDVNFSVTVFQGKSKFAPPFASKGEQYIIDFPVNITKGIIISDITDKSPYQFDISLTLKATILDKINFALSEFHALDSNVKFQLWDQVLNDEIDINLSH